MLFWGKKSAKMLNLFARRPASFHILVFHIEQNKCYFNFELKFSYWRKLYEFCPKTLILGQQGKITFIWELECCLLNIWYVHEKIVFMFLLGVLKKGNTPRPQQEQNNPSITVLWALSLQLMKDSWKAGRQGQGATALRGNHP